MPRQNNRHNCNNKPESPSPPPSTSILSLLPNLNPVGVGAGVETGVDESKTAASTALMSFLPDLSAIGEEAGDKSNKPPPPPLESPQSSPESSPEIWDLSELGAISTTSSASVIHAFDSHYIDFNLLSSTEIFYIILIVLVLYCFVGWLCWPRLRGPASTIPSNTILKPTQFKII